MKIILSLMIVFIMSGAYAADARYWILFAPTQSSYQVKITNTGGNKCTPMSLTVKDKAAINQRIDCVGNKASAALNPTEITFKVKDKNNKIQSCSIRFKVSVDAHEVTSGFKEYKRHCISRIQKDISKCHIPLELTKKDKKTNREIPYKSTRKYTYEFNVKERQHVHSDKCYDDKDYPIRIQVTQTVDNTN